MDFTTRQKLAIEEVNAVLKKFGLGMQTYLEIQQAGIRPLVRLVDIEVTEAENKVNKETKETQETHEEKPTKATKEKKVVKTRKPKAK